MSDAASPRQLPQCSTGNELGIGRWRANLFGTCCLRGEVTGFSGGCRLHSLFGVFQVDIRAVAQDRRLTQECSQAEVPGATVRSSMPASGAGRAKIRRLNSARSSLTLSTTRNSVIRTRTSHHPRSGRSAARVSHRASSSLPWSSVSSDFVKHQGKESTTSIVTYKWIPMRSRLPVRDCRKISSGLSNA